MVGHMNDSTLVAQKYLGSPGTSRGAGGTVYGRSYRGYIIPIALQLGHGTTLPQQ